MYMFFEFAKEDMFVVVVVYIYKSLLYIICC